MKAIDPPEIMSLHPWGHKRSIFYNFQLYSQLLLKIQLPDSVQKNAIENFIVIESQKCIMNY